MGTTRQENFEKSLLVRSKHRCKYLATRVLENPFTGLPVGTVTECMSPCRRAIDREVKNLEVLRDDLKDQIKHNGPRNILIPIIRVLDETLRQFWNETRAEDVLNYRVKGE